MQRFKTLPFAISSMLLLCGTSALGLFALEPAAAQSSSDAVTYLDQAWSQADRETYYQIPQGSSVISYDIFLNLEVAGSQDLLRSDAISERYGLILQAANPRTNPDALPIGLTKTVIAEGRWKGERPFTRDRSRSELVEQAEKLALAEMDEPLHVSAVCRALGVSERTLRKAFYVTCGLPPCRRLRMLRLSEARRALLAADCRRVTVTQIATGFGFESIRRKPFPDAAPPIPDQGVSPRYLGQSPCQLWFRRILMHAPDVSVFAKAGDFSVASNNE